MTATDTKELTKRGGIAAVAALLANIALLQVVLRLGLVEPFRPATAGPIGTFTVLGVIGATVSGVIFLMLLHVITAVICVQALTGGYGLDLLR